MQQLTFLGPGELEWRAVEEPRLEQPTDALVRPVAVTLCDVDRAFLDGRFPIAGPFPFGHEFVAETLALGSDVRGFRPGELVVVCFQIACGTCDRCVSGLSGSCRAVPELSAFGFGPLGGAWGGAFSDVVCVPYAASMLVRVPEGVPPTLLASASDNLCDAWRCVAPHLETSPGAEVLVMGGVGSIPLYAVDIARALGASRVDYVDTDRSRLEIAAKLGARAIEGCNPDRASEYPVTVDGSADPAGLCAAIRSTAPYGVCTSVGIYLHDVALPLREMYLRGIRFITGRVNSRARVGHVLELLEARRLHPELVTTELIRWPEAAEALRRPSMKPLVLRDEAGAR